MSRPGEGKIVSESPRPPLTADPRTNVEHLAAALDSILAFHGLRPHVTVQVAEALALKHAVVHTGVLPVEVRKAILPYTRR